MIEYSFTGFEIEQTVFQIYKINNTWGTSNPITISKIIIDSRGIWYQGRGESIYLGPNDLFENKDATLLECVLRNEAENKCGVK